MTTDWARCREAACRSCGAVFNLGPDDEGESRRTWRLWNLRYNPCPACGSADDWCEPFDGVPVPRGFVFGGAGAASFGAAVIVFSVWGLVFVAAGVAVLAWGVVLSRQQWSAAKKRGRVAGARLISQVSEEEPTK